MARARSHRRPVPPPILFAPDWLIESFRSDGAAGPQVGQRATELLDAVEALGPSQGLALAQPTSCCSCVIPRRSPPNHDDY